MPDRFADAVVMITGAAGGFGSAAAQRFAAEGAMLLLSDADEQALDKSVGQLPEETKFFAQAIDVTDKNAMMSHLQLGEKQLGPLTIGVNNAGIGQALAPLQDIEDAAFDRIMAVNLKGVFNAMAAQLPGMIARRSGSILNIASAAGLVGAGHLAAYAASKHGVVGLTRSAADEVARFGVRVNALCPSFAPTALFNDMADQVAVTHGTDRITAYDTVTKRVPMRRVATIDEVVQAMLWSVDPENSFMTGQAVAIDGGLTAI